MGSSVLLPVRGCLIHRVVVSLLLLLCLGCSSTLVSDEEPVDVEPGYVFGLLESGGANSHYVPFATGVRTEWNLSNGIVVLGPEEEVLGPGESGPPQYRLELHLRATGQDGQASILVAMYSTTDVQFGTGEELNGKLYTLGAEKTCSVESISAGHIAVTEICDIRLERVIVNEGDEPETIEGFGFTFIAVDQ